MKLLPFTIIATTLAFALFSPDTASAKGKNKKSRPAPVKIDASGSTISKVGGDSITIEYSKTSTTYKMTNDTQITVDGHRARSADLKPGMRAEFGESKLHPGVLSSIQASSK